MKLEASLKRQLLALGIPEELHTSEGLAAFFPPEFNIAKAELEPAVLAGMLLRFVEHKLIDMPSQIPSDRLPPGLHVCQFYRNEDELLEFVTPYFRQGLRQDAFCVWVLPEPMTVAGAAAALGARIEGVEDCIARGQFEILHQHDCYTDASGKMKPIDQIIEGFLFKAREALGRGFTGTRVAGDGSWSGRLDDQTPFLEYEKRATQAVKGQKITGLCTYRLSNCDEPLVKSVVDLHKESFLKTGLFWEGFRDYREARSRAVAALRELKTA